MLDNRSRVKNRGSVEKRAERFKGKKSQHTNFALVSVLATKKHTRTVAHEAGTAVESTAEALAALGSLHREIGTHRLGDQVNVFAGLEALLRQQLDLGTAVAVSKGEFFRVKSRAPWRTTYRFWNQIWTDLSVMLICSAIMMRVSALGVGFLLNSSSSVVSWSCVARWRFWFFCCCVSVLLRAGRFDAEALWLVAEAEGDGVCELLVVMAELGVGMGAAMELELGVVTVRFMCMGVCCCWGCWCIGAEWPISWPIPMGIIMPGCTGISTLISVAISGDCVFAGYYETRVES